MTTGDLEPASPGGKLLSLGRSTVDRSKVFFFVRKVEVQVQATPDTGPDSVPCFVTGPSTSSSSWSCIPCAWGGSRSSSVVSWAMTRFAVPDVGSGGVAKASAEYVDSAVASIAIHCSMSAVDVTTDEAWSLFVEHQVIDDQGGIDVGLLLLLLDNIGSVGWAIEKVAKFDKIEACATDGATVGSFDPRAQARVVEVVSAREKVSDDFIVYGMFTVWIVSTGLES